MIKVWRFVAPIIFVAAVGCEDGPKQPFQASPPGAGDQWNNGQSAPVVTGGTQPFDAGYPTTGKTTICSDDLKRERWGWMLEQPIIPPVKYAGINMAKDDLWHGLTIDDAETAPPDPSMPGGGLCQSVPLGFIGGCPSGIGSCNSNYWGNNQEVIFTWNLATHLVDQMELQLGYQGIMTATSDPAATVCDKTNPSGPVVMQGKHTYEIRIGDVIKKDGQPFLIDWFDSKARGCEITEIFNAMLNTFGPAAGIPYAPAKNCSSDGNCLVFNSQGVTIFGVRPLALYFEGSSSVPQPGLSTPTLLYNFSTKYQPYSNIPQVLTLDPNGPVAQGIARGAKPQGTCTTVGASCTLSGGGTGQCDTDSNCKVLCSQQVGVSFGNMKTNCIQVSGQTTVDTVNLNKVQYGLTHDQEHWTANIMGVNQNFTSSKVASNPDLVVLDTDTPQDQDIAQDWTFDIRARGQALNDYKSNGRPDMRGSAMIYIQWANLMLADIAKIMGTPVKKLGDATCTNGQFQKGCSGIEGLIIPAGVAFGVAPPNWPAEGYPSSWAGYDQNALFYYASILKPGDIVGGFCTDPGSYTDCSATNSPWDQAEKWVVRRLGNGDPAQIPSELRDRRYYYKWFAVAYLQYLKAYSHCRLAANPTSALAYTTCDVADDTGVTPAKVAAEEIDQESLFFDSPNAFEGNNFDKFEYVDREYINQGQTGTAGAPYNWVPWDFEYGSDIIGGNQRYDNWYRRMDREEIAMYASMLTDKTHTPGQENNVSITNLFGSSILSGNWGDYHCAIGDYASLGGTDSSTCGVPPPLDTTRMKSCTPNAACDGTVKCVGSCTVGTFCAQGVTTFTNGAGNFCGADCTTTACPSGFACIASADGITKSCLPMMMDKNGTQSNAKPMMSYYPGAWTRTPFSMGHSPITLHAADKHPQIGVAKITIPNFAAGPYTPSPQLATYTATGASTCAAAGTGWTLDIPNGNWCNAPLATGSPAHNVPVGPGANINMNGPSFSTLVPWLEKQPGVGFNFPIDGQHDQEVVTAQMDFTGVLETYIVDFLPWVDTAGKGANPSCAGGTPCGAGYTCNPVSQACEKSDDTIQIFAIEGSDFVGQAFTCQDPHTGDILGVRQYESAQSIIDWMAAHPGGWNAVQGAFDPSAQTFCNIIVRQSPANNYVDFISSKSYGVKLSVTQGSGQGRVVDITLWDPSIVQAP